MGHIHLNVNDVDAATRFWQAVGATPSRLGDAAVMKLPGVLIELRKQTPIGPSMGTVVDHLGFQVPDIQAAVARWKAAGIKVVPGSRPEQVYLFSADELRLEILENRNQTIPVATHHVHIMVAEAQASDMHSWYVRLFGAQPGVRGANQTADVPGYSFSFGKAPAPTLPTKGRAIDHIGFEVKNLKVFCERLEAMGVKLDTPYRPSRHPGLFIAELTDPWGTSIELTEGLASLVP